MLTRTVMLALSLCLPMAATAADQVIAEDVLEDRNGVPAVAFLAKELETDAECRLQDSDLESPHAPWSTFKIPNLLIALETGVAEDLGAFREWDQARRPAKSFWPDAWKQDHTLESAFQASVVWYFQDVAQEVGSQRYAETLRDWTYGNATVPEGSDDFWLGNGLGISVAGQVDFLSRLLSGDVPVSDASLAALSQASAAESGPGFALHGKTGGGFHDDGSAEGWYVGWVAREDRAPAVFALYAEGSNWAAIRDFRKASALTMLTECGILPEGSSGS